MMGNAAFAQDNQQISPEGRATMGQFWKKRYEEIRGKPTSLDLRKKRTEKIISSLQSQTPDLKSIYSLIDQDHKITHKEQEESTDTLMRMLKTLSVEDQIIFLHNLYSTTPPPIIRVDPKL
jgi:hypothetical protein